MGGEVGVGREAEDRKVANKNSIHFMTETLQ